MKKILFSLLLLSFLSTTVMAQQPMRATSDNRNKEMRANKDENKKHPASATEAAKAQTQQMKTLLQLSDSQCRKIYPILLRNHQNDSVMNAQIGQMRKEQKNRHKNQCEEIKKILTPEQQAAMMAMPAFAGESGKATSWNSDKKHDNGSKKSDRKEGGKQDMSREKMKK